MLSMIIAAIVGAALIRMSLAQARFMDQQEAWRSARSVARGGINRLISDLRSVEATNGVTAAVAGGQDFTIRVPYAFGVMCATTGVAGTGPTTLSLLPVDSAVYAAPGYSGFAVPGSRRHLYVCSQRRGDHCRRSGTCTGALPLPISLADGRAPGLNGSPRRQDRHHSRCGAHSHAGGYRFSSCTGPSITSSRTPSSSPAAPACSGPR